MTKLIKVKRAHGVEVEGSVLVMNEGFSPRYDLNRITGRISRIGHSAEGMSLSGQILIIPSAKGGVAGGWAFFDMLEKCMAPKALIFGRLNPVMVQGAILAQIPIAEGWSEDLLGLIKTGDQIRFNPTEKTIELL
jgi:predicted aconitase with swiveling domain